MNGDAARAELVARLRVREVEIVRGVFARVRAVAEPVEDADAEYLDGLRAAVEAAVDFALMGLEHGDHWQGPMPRAASGQARRAARGGVRLDTVLRRYAAGDGLLEEFIIEEGGTLGSDQLRMVLRAKRQQLDQLMAFVAAEYVHELEQTAATPAQRLAERVEALLGGGTDTGEIDYPFADWHLGLIANGEGAEQILRSMAHGLDRRLLLVPRGEGMVWGWFGGRRPLAVSAVERVLASPGTRPEVAVSLGEPCHGLEGWRLTHREAQAAQQVMARSPQPLIRGTDVLLLAAVLRDETMARSLRATFLAPLGLDGVAGSMLRETLRAYFAAGGNAAAAASALRVNRGTVKRRLRKAEQALGRDLDACHAELDVALRLEQVTGTDAPRRDQSSDGSDPE